MYAYSAKPHDEVTFSHRRMFLFFRDRASPYLKESAVERSGYLVPEIRYLGIDCNVQTGEVNYFSVMSGGDADPMINCGLTIEQECSRLPKQVRYFWGGLGRMGVIKSTFCSSNVNKMKFRIIGGMQVWHGMYFIWCWGRYCWPAV